MSKETKYIFVTGGVLSSLGKGIAAASIATLLKNVGYIAVAVLILLVMITVHEAGHYFVGKIFKFKINAFV